MPLFEYTLFRNLFTIIPFVTALDGFRRVWLGGTGLSYFIDISSGMLIPPDADLNRMRWYLDQEQAVWDAIPGWLQAPLTPFCDYHDACQAVLDMFLSVHASDPTRCESCEEYHKLTTE